MSLVLVGNFLIDQSDVKFGFKFWLKDTAKNRSNALSTEKCGIQ